MRKSQEYPEKIMRKSKESHEYIYQGEVMVGKYNLNNFLPLAEEFQVQGLAEITMNNLHDFLIP